MSKAAVTVAQLITALQAVEDQALPVYLEGCDCINPATGEVEITMSVIGTLPEELLVIRADAS